MTPELEVLLELVPRLEQHGIEYMLTGSMALMTYAQPRMTRDVDLVVSLKKDQVETLLKVLGPSFECDEEAMLEAIQYQKMFNAIHVEKVVKLDFVIRKNVEFRLEEFRRRVRTQLLGVPIFVVSLEDLVLSKLVWARDAQSEYQLRDVRSLLRHQPKPDFEYLDKWSDVLGVKELLHETLES